MYYINYRNKYNARSCQYNGRTYHSRAEAEYAMYLDSLLKKKEIKSWTPQYKIDIRVNDVHIANYYVDFKVEHNDGTIEYIEVKGFRTQVGMMKFRILQAMMKDKENVKVTMINV